MARISFIKGRLLEGKRASRAAGEAAKKVKNCQKCIKKLMIFQANSSFLIY
jgi:hypothetical protein